MQANRDEAVIAGFGDEWSRFDNLSVSDTELESIFDGYFSIFPWQRLPPEPVGADFGCGSGRWARFVAPRVGHLYCVDPSGDALAVARSALNALDNVTFIEGDVESGTIQDSSLDFAYSLGVLHHIPDTRRAMRTVVSRLKPGAPLLVYLYYRFDNRPAWFRATWSVTETLRSMVSSLPYRYRFAASQVLAVTLYWPMARISRLAEAMGANVSNVPLAAYRNRSFYVMRTDALDRFGTRLEQRFTREEISAMMRECGLENVAFSDSAPFWCAVGFRAR